MFGCFTKYLCVSGLLLASLQLVACQQSESVRVPETTIRLLQESSAVKIVAFGDSVTRGYGVSQPWSQILKNQLQKTYPSNAVTVLNAGRDGHTAADGLARLERDVIRHIPDLVLVAFGLNDLKLGRSPEQLQSDLDAMVIQLEAAGCEVVLMTTNLIQAGIYSLRLKDYNMAIRRLASQRSLPLVDVAHAWEVALEDVAAEDLLSDVAHPTLRGHQIIAAAVFTLFEP